MAKERPADQPANQPAIAPKAEDVGSLRWWIGLLLNPFFEQVTVKARDVGVWTQDMEPDPQEPGKLERVYKRGRIVELTDKEVAEFKQMIRNFVITVEASPKMVDLRHPAVRTRADEVIPLARLIYCVSYDRAGERKREPEPIEALTDADRRLIERQKAMHARAKTKEPAQVDERKPVMVDV